MKVAPTTDRGRVRRLLDAACMPFGSQGVRTTSLDEIGAAADMGRGRLYHFFVDKADLVAEVVAFQADRVIVSLRPSFEATSTADDVRTWCDRWSRFTRRPLRRFGVPSDR